MKKIVGFILVVLCCAVFAFNDNYTRPQVAQAKATYVYVCTGSYATKYHSRSNCRGLGNCKGQIVKITEEQAQKQGRPPCKLCYR